MLLQNLLQNCKQAWGNTGALWRSVGQDSELNGPRWRTLAHAKVAFRPASKRLLAQTSLAEQTPTRSGADWPPATCRSSLLRWGPRRATSWTVSETSPRRPRRLAAAVNLLLGNSWKFPCAGSTGERAFSRRQSYVAFRSSYSFVRLWRSPLEMCGHGLEAIHSCFRAFTLINSRWRSSVQGHEDHGTGGVEALRLGEAALAAWRRLRVRHHEAVALARIAELRSHHG